ncbi:hypothetical protein BU16DRAFT_156303 [Lophium mytilinum]|uniref:P-loop containing nucleoside triphosphate hydrolase protein n=1 Tax=Lophium mytilinum TaxID=390894 RepID=A0A6A6QER5_9PEZI|nr:hypothetical protein BU16DRAFT_156303 [Lophium mytilinum]
MAEKDPWHWSVDEVVDALCSSKDIYDEAGCNNATLPDLTAFGQQLRNEEVNGWTLLTGMDASVLKEDFQIKALGHRRTLLETIKYLQGKSVIYRQKNPTQFPITFDTGFHTPGSGYLPGRAPSIQSPPIYYQGALPAFPKIDELPDIGPSEQLLLEAGLSSTVAGHGRHAGVDRPMIDVDSHGNSISDIAVHVRAGENLVVDQSGKKRRRLKTLVVESQPRPTSNYGFQATPSFPIKDIFFRGGASGDDVDEEDEFCSFGQAATPADAKRYVYRQMLHFLRGPEQEEVERDGQQALAVYPYRKGIDTSDGPRPAIVFQTLNNDVRVTQESHPTKTDDPMQEDSHSGHEWDFLQHWAEEPGEELRPYGESGSEISCSSSFFEQLEDEEREREEARAKNGGPLSSTEVSDVVEEVVAEFRDDWREKKLPLRKYNAWREWKKARKSMDREQLLEDAKIKKDHLDNRLAKYKKEISSQIWKKSSELRRQCFILEETVYQQEVLAWKVSVWQRNSAPPRPATKPKTRTKVHKKLQSDEEILSSDEAASEGISNFVDADENDFTQFELHSPQAGPVSQSTQPNSASSSPIKLRQKHAARVSREPGGSTLEGDEDRMDLDQEVETTDVKDMTTVDDSGLHNTNPDHDPDYEASAPITPQNQTPQKIRTPNSVIDLTLSADESAPEDTPSQPLVYPRSEWLKGNPEHASADMIASWETDFLEERSDRKRLIIKILSEVNSEDREILKTRLLKLRERDLLDEMRRGIGALARGDPRLSGVSKEDSRKIMMFARLYLCWFSCDSRWWTEIVSRNPPNHRKDDQEVFYNFLKLVLLQTKPDGRQSISRLQTPTKKSNKKTIFQASPIAISSPAGPETDESDEEMIGAESQNTHKRRKRAVAQSQVALQKRESAQMRRQEQERFEEQLDSSQAGQEVSTDSIMINTSKLDEHGAVFLNKFIAGKIKKHQIEGVRFMWREIITAASSGSQGCLLAHTMGLGKTMQAITLLVTITEAAHSKEMKIKSQIPEELRESRTLVLCPAALIPNWVEEFDMWVPPLTKRLIGARRPISADTLFERRIDDIEEWYEEGGILLISYEMLRKIVENKATKLSVNGRLPEDRHEELLHWLFEGPNIIIADEAHIMKNPKTGLSLACSRFKTKNRIALTGSPLNNNLLEYYEMIQWVSPGYLGNNTEFKAHYQEPIHLGLWGDSSDEEYRMALRLLRVLKNEIEPKVNRADITVLKGSLKAKVEFVIQVPLTALQEEIYRTYVENLLSGPARGEDNVSRTRLWSWLAILVLLCSHPQIFFDKVLDLLKNDARLKKLPKAAPGRLSDTDGRLSDTDGRQLDTEDDGIGQPEVHPIDQDVEDISLQSLQSPLTTMEAQKAIYNRVKKEVGNMNQSFKMEAVQKIIKYSKEVGDRVLIFSHSIPILNFLERYCNSSKTVYQRIDGSVKSSSRQAQAKAFNQGTRSASVFLISTRSGGLGLNLPGANRVIILDISFNPTWEEQAIGRAYRIGQEKPVFVYRFLTAGTFEIPVYNKAVFKTQLSYRAVDKKNVKAVADREENLLQVPQRVERENLDRYMGKDPFVLDRILSGGGTSWICSISTMETLQEEIAENFTPEELEEIRQMEYREKLRKSEPEKWKRLVHEDHIKKQAEAAEARLREQQRQAQFTNPQPPPHSFVQTPSFASGMSHRPQFLHGMPPSLQQAPVAIRSIGPNVPPSGFPALVPNGLPDIVLRSDRPASSSPLLMQNGRGQPPANGFGLTQPTGLQMRSSAPPRPTGPPRVSNSRYQRPQDPQVIHEISSAEDEDADLPVNGEARHRKGTLGQDDNQDKPLSFNDRLGRMQR